MCLKSLHLAGSASLLALMENIPEIQENHLQSCPPSPSKNTGTVKSLGALHQRLQSTSVTELSPGKEGMIPRPQSTLESTHTHTGAHRSWLCNHYGSYRSDSKSFGFPSNQETTSRPAGVGRGCAQHMCIIFLPVNFPQCSLP